MGLFARKQSTAPGTGDDWERRLDGLEPLQVHHAEFRARVLGVGRRGTRRIPAVELAVSGTAGHFRADELESFLGGRLGILETLHSSPTPLFMATGAHAGADSPAGDALAHAARDEAAVLQPVTDGLHCLALFSPADQQRITRWLALFPRP